MDSILFAANAKINLALSVIGKRNDSYHELDTVMQTVDISDEISIKKSRFFSFESDSFNGENNIAFKAAALFFRCGGDKAAGANKNKKVHSVFCRTRRRQHGRRRCAYRA